MKARHTPAEQSQRQSDSMDNDLHELFLDQLADVYHAEKQLTEALPKMAEAANSEDLRAAFEAHLEETENHVARLEKVAQSINETLQNKKCKAMQGLIKEAEEILEENEDSAALDAALIIAAQKVEHYEIATYGGLRTWAERLGHAEAVELLNQTLSEEKAADEKLTHIAEEHANADGEAN